MASFAQPDAGERERLETHAESHRDERSELTAILESEGFRRAPKISQLLSYLCEKYFNGQAEDIGEYSIAVEVLGRDSEFDPKLDAVVRVDTHHLRKRLKQYYEHEGKDHAIEIVIPPGQYMPKFIRRLEAPPLEQVAVEETAPVKSEWASLVRLWPLLVGAAVIVVALAVVISVFAKTRLKEPAAVVFPQGDEIRILAGGNHPYVDTAGHAWLPDRFFNGGDSFRRTAREILRTRDPAMFQSGREGQFAYEIPLKQGIYELRLYFAETAVNSENLRSVTVAINGIPTPTLDIVSDAGAPATATVKIIEGVEPAKDSILHLTFQGNPGFVNALEILPGVKGKMRPLRWWTGDTPYHDHLGRDWLPDQWFAGANLQPQRRHARDG